MVTSINNVQSGTSVADFSVAAATPSQSVDSFAQQLLSAIEGYIGKSGSGSQLEINIQSTGQNSAGGSQFLVSVQNAPAATGSSSPSTASPSTAAASVAQTPAAVASPADATDTTGSSSTGTGSLTAAQLAQMTPTEAYWAEQPPAVQALQNMPMDQRVAAAEDLASQGYTIDVPIMVWGWDPLATMLTREVDGYTWVPSAMQSPVAVAPGTNYAASPSYDPTSPPAGSILVSTAFANGTNGQDAAAKYFETAPTS